MAKKPKLDLSPGGAALNNPFAALEAHGLPAGVSTEATPARPEPPKPGRLGRVVLRREKAHRGGKTGVVIYDFAPRLWMKFIEAPAGRLEAARGFGGTAKA